MYHVRIKIEKAIRLIKSLEHQYSLSDELRANIDSAVKLLEEALKELERY